MKPVYSKPKTPLSSEISGHKYFSSEPVKFYFMLTLFIVSSIKAELLKKTVIHGQSGPLHTKQACGHWHLLFCYQPQLFHVQEGGENNNHKLLIEF